MDQPAPVFEHTLRTAIPNEKAELTSTISFRKPTGGDIMRCGNPVKYMPHDESQEVTFDEMKMAKMMSALSGIPLAMIERMDPNDMAECSWGLARFFIPGMNPPPAT